MSIKVLECRSVLPDTTCTLMFTGEEDEIVPAFSLHVASAHGETLDDELAARLTGALREPPALPSLTPAGGQPWSPRACRRSSRAPWPDSPSFTYACER